MSELARTTWAFGGPLADAPADAGWTLLAAAAVLGALWAWLSHRHSVHRIGLFPAVVLTLLRTALLALLLLCLANPVKIQRTTASAPEPPPPAAVRPPQLAVLVDRSDSMTHPDNRGRTRLDDALATWRRLAKPAQEHFGAIHYFSFAEDLNPAKTLEEASTRQGATHGTRLHHAVSTVLEGGAGERPDAIVILTDGIDTSGESESSLRDAALNAGVPLYFVAGANRGVRFEPFVRVRELRVPPAAQRRTEFTIEVTFESYSRFDRTEHFSLWQAGRRLLRGELALTMGANVVTRSFTVSAREAGPVDFAVRIGPDDEAPLAARALTQVLSQQEGKIRVLVHQSTLDWGLRYLTAALRTDPTFEYFTLVTTNLGLSLASGSQSGSTIIGQLPDSVAPLAQFHCVVLVRPSPRDLTAVQQEVLVSFARSGGTVFFVSPEPEAMAQFGSSPLENLLPVYLSAEAPRNPGDTPSREELSAPRATVAGKARGNPVRNARDTPDPRKDDPADSKLTSFALTEAGRASPIFARAGQDSAAILPRFLEYAATLGPKPAAEVLAVHPTAVDATTGGPQVLLATQTFGLGRSALLTTDTLWRWKLDEPSESKLVETFWQQLVLAICRRAEKQVLRFAAVPPQVATGQVTTLRVGGALGDQPPVITAKAADGRASRLIAKHTEDKSHPWSVEWTPESPGNWEITAELESTLGASVFTAAAAQATGELAASSPPLDLLRALAGETGGALLTTEVPASWRKESEPPEKKPETMTAEHRIYRWNNWPMLSTALGCFALELILRRLWKLL